MSEYIYDWTPNKQHRKEKIVRCRDCKYSVAHGNGCTWWAESGSAIDAEPDGFCAWGKGGSNERA